MAISNVFKYRMDGGIPGAVNRMHPADIAAQLIDANAPPTAYGQPVLVDPTTQGMRPIGAGDGAVTKIYGITVRPFPIQQPQAAADFAAIGFGSAVPPSTGVLDVLRAGYMTVQVPAGQSAVKGGTVYIYTAATGGGHTQSGFETGAGANLIAITNAVFNGTPDANGNVEIEIWKQ